MCGAQLNIDVSIVCDAGAYVTVYETNTFDGACVEYASVVSPRDGKTGLIDCSGEGQINFVVNLDPGYRLTGVSAEPVTSFKNLKDPSETGVSNGYRLTKVTGNLTVTVTAEQTAPAFERYSLLLSGEIGVKFYMNLDCLTDEEKAASYMTFSIPHGTCTELENFNGNDTLTKDSVELHGFTCYINSIQMAEPITATYHYFKDGEELTVSKK